METTQKLRLIASKPCALGQVDFTNNNKTLIKKAFKEEHKVGIIAYFHGEVEDFIGYDIGACLNGEVCEDFNKNLYKEGIYDAELIGYDKPLKVFLWNVNKMPRGLIVCKDNEKDMKYAKEKYNSRNLIIKKL